MVTQVAIKYEKDQIIAQMIEKLPPALSDQIRMVDLLLTNGRKEDATIVLSNAIASIKRQTPNYHQRLIFLTQEALSRNLTEQALNAVSKLSLYLGEQAYAYMLSAPGDMRAADTMPDREKISIPLFYGMLNEELQFDDKAEAAYIRVVLRSLKLVMESYGHSLPESLNDFHLLGRMWQVDGNVVLLEKLDSVYSYLEEQHLRDVQAENEKKLVGLRNELGVIEQQYQQKLANVESLRAQARKEVRAVTLKMVSAIATIIFLLIVVLGCLWKGYQYKNRLSAHKAFGFVAKSVEALGWIRVMSVIGVLSGLVTVFVAQLFLILQRIHEDGKEPREIKTAQALPPEVQQVDAKPVGETA